MQTHLFANWKLYLSETASVRFARSLRSASKNVELAIFPSEVALSNVANVIHSNVRLGSQNIAPVGGKAATGEVSGLDLKKLGCKYVIVGHSERRALGENDATIRSKLAAAARSRLIPVLCVGETKITRISIAQRSIRTQLERDLKGWKGKTLFVAYEPVWAISKAGKGHACPPKHAFAMGEFIQRQLVRLVPKGKKVLLYGGSVKAENIAEYVDGKTFHGALVGHASTKRAELAAMLRALA